MSRRISKEIISKMQAGECGAEQYVVSTKAIYTWLRQDTGEGAVSGLQYNKLKWENEELKRLSSELMLDRHLQKKLK